MRIVAGRYRRRKLLASPGQTTRPITDRARESLFARLEHELEDARVADVFSGTGTLGLESLSRGAVSVTFFENDRKAFELLRRNVAALDVTDDVFTWQVDILRTSFRPRRQEHRLPYDVVFFDPPYRMAAGIRPGEPLYRSLTRLARAGISRADTLLVLRIPRKCDLELPPCWQQFEEFSIQSMEVRLCRLTEPLVPAESPGDPPDDPPTGTSDVSPPQPGDSSEDSTVS